jgi:hypothetical protein
MPSFDVLAVIAGYHLRSHRPRLFKNLSGFLRLLSSSDHAFCSASEASPRKQSWRFMLCEHAPPYLLLCQRMVSALLSRSRKDVTGITTCFGLALPRTGVGPGRFRLKFYRRRSRSSVDRKDAHSILLLKERVLYLVASDWLSWLCS